MIKLNWNYHSHTSYTDGSDTVEEIAHHCDKLGIEEIAITEHVTKELTYDFDQFLLDINKANQQFNVHVLSGLEARILVDGTLDCPEGLTKKVNIVIGSVHNLNNMTGQEAYEKLAETDCKIIGHPQFFNEKVISSLKRTGKIVELSGRYPQPDDMITAFRKAGLLFSVGLDSHRLGDFEAMDEMEALIEKFSLRDRLWRFGD